MRIQDFLNDIQLEEVRNRDKMTGILPSNIRKKVGILGQNSQEGYLLECQLYPHSQIHKNPAGCY